jgi:hypothetical protein
MASEGSGSPQILQGNLLCVLLGEGKLKSALCFHSGRALGTRD